jgi:hypothetical protein
VSEELNIGLTTIRAAKTDLKKKKILLSSWKGLPAKEWLKINFTKLLQVAKVFPSKPLISGYVYSCAESAQQALRDPHSKPYEIRTAYNNINIITNKNKINKNKFLENSRQIPPTLEMIKEYCQKRKNGIDPSAFFDHYEARGWKPKGYTTQMKDWQAAVRQWERNDRNNTFGTKKEVIQDEDLPDRIKKLHNR